MENVKLPISDRMPSNIDALPYDLPYLTNELRKKAKLELFEDEETKIQSLKLLKHMLDGEDKLNYPKDDENLLLAFLRTKKFDVKKTFHLVKTYYAVKMKHEELYGNFTSDVIQNTIDDGSIGYLPYRDDDGAVILIFNVGRINPRRVTHGDIMRLLTFGLHQAIQSPATQVAGIKVIADMKNFAASTLLHVSPTYLWLLAEALQNCFPARFKGVYVVNETALINPVWGIMKKFVKQKLADRVHFQGKNMSKLHKYINPKILPKEYGGELPHYTNAEWGKKFMEDYDYFYKLSTYGYVKSTKI